MITEDIEVSEPFSEKELDEILKQLKSGKSSGPDGIPPEIFINGGKKFEELLLKVVNEVKRTVEIPTQWNDVDITTLYKNKGKRKDLNNQRGIFLTSVGYKLFERLIMNRMSDVTDKINLLQAGGRKGRSAADQTFILRSMINHSIYLNRTLFAMTINNASINCDFRRHYYPCGDSDFQRNM